MKVSVFGLGYVGCVTSACLAELGHEVVGVDVQPAKVEAVNAGHAPVAEPKLDGLIAKHVEAGRLRATTDAGDAVRACEIALICVGTPGQPNVAIDLSHVERVVQEIGAGVRTTDSQCVVVVRSTCLPGTAETMQERLNEAAGQTVPLMVNPEFLREGSAVSDFFAPAFVLIGATDEASAVPVREMYAGLDAEKIVVPLRTAEAVKYASNAFHAVKVTFANEIGRWSAGQGVDGRAVMELVAKDRVLNISEKYLTPGFAFGGSCLPKDLRALLHQARHNDVELEMLHSVLQSNQQHIQRAMDMIIGTGKARIGILGLAFKADTDDVRESPMVLLVEQLLGKGYRVKIHDPQLSLGRVLGANRAYLEMHIPHIASLLVESVDEMREQEVLVVGQRNPMYVAAPTQEQIVIDLVGAFDARETARGLDVRPLV